MSLKCQWPFLVVSTDGELAQRIQPTLQGSSEAQQLDDAVASNGSDSYQPMQSYQLETIPSTQVSCGSKGDETIQTTQAVRMFLMQAGLSSPTSSDQHKCQQILQALPLIHHQATVSNTKASDPMVAPLCHSEADSVAGSAACSTPAAGTQAKAGTAAALVKSIACPAPDWAEAGVAPELFVKRTAVASTVADDSRAHHVGVSDCAEAPDCVQQLMTVKTSVEVCPKALSGGSATDIVIAVVLHCILMRQCCTSSSSALPTEPEDRSI